MPTIEWTLNLGTIASLMFIAGGFYFVTRKDIGAIKEDLKMLNKAVADIAVQNTRLDNQAAMIAATQKQQAVLESRIYDLSRGRGFIQQDINGEYNK